MIFTWWNKYSLLQVNCNDKHFKEYIVFGFGITNDDFITLNYVILTAKKYIHSKNCKKEENLNLYEYLLTLRNNLMLETRNEAKYMYIKLLEYLT